MKKPILVSLILSKHPLNALMLPPSFQEWPLVPFILSSRVNSSFSLILDSPLHILKTSMRSCLFLLFSSVHSFKHCNLSSCLSFHVVNHLCKSPPNLLDQLFVFYIVWIPRTKNTIFNVRPNECFIQTHHYSGILIPTLY